MKSVIKGSFFGKIRTSDKGAQLYEYSLLVLVLAIGLIFAVRLFGVRVMQSLQSSHDALVAAQQ